MLALTAGSAAGRRYQRARCAPEWRWWNVVHKGRGTNIMFWTLNVMSRLPAATSNAGK